MKPYHPANLRSQPYGHKRVILLAWIAKFLGVQFQIGGLPFGGAHKPMPWEQQMMAERNMANAMAQGNFAQSNIGGLANGKMAQGEMIRQEMGGIWKEPVSGTTGRIDAMSARSGQMLARINDRWFKFSELVPA